MMKQVAMGLENIYNSPTLVEAEKVLDAFSDDTFTYHFI